MNPEITPPTMPDPQLSPVVNGVEQTSGNGPSKKRLMLAVAAAAVLIVAIGTVTTLLHKSNDGNGTAVALSTKVADVSIGDSGYTPKSITVQQGQQITFTNNGTTPRLLSADPTVLPSFNTVEPLDQGDSYTYIFDQKGTFHYYDATDPTDFVGTITVQ